MGKVVLVGGKKGGTGKSTIATNLAAYRASKIRDGTVLIIDTDTQGSSAEWAHWRNNEGLSGIECIQLFGKNIRSEMESKRKRYGNIIVDAGGRDSKELRYAMIVADIMLIPLGPSQHDLNTIPDLAEIIEDVRTVNPTLDCYAFINKIKNHARIHDGHKTQEVVSQYDVIKTLDCMVHDRISFTRSAEEGRGVHEMLNKKNAPVDPKAVDEIKNIYEVVYGTETQK